MHFSDGILAHSSTENGLQILLEKCYPNLFCILWSLVLSLDFPCGWLAVYFASVEGFLALCFGLQCPRWCHLQLPVRQQWIFIRNYSGGLLVCIIASEEFSFGIRLDSGLIQMSRNKHSETVHRGPWKSLLMILFTPVRNLAMSTRSWSGYDCGPTGAYRNIQKSFCNNYLVELVMTPLRPLVVGTEPADINLH